MNYHTICLWFSFRFVFWWSEKVGSKVIHCKLATSWRGRKRAGKNQRVVSWITGWRCFLRSSREGSSRKLYWWPPGIQQMACWYYTSILLSFQYIPSWHSFGSQLNFRPQPTRMGVVTNPIVRFVVCIDYFILLFVMYYNKYFFYWIQTGNIQLQLFI